MSHPPETSLSSRELAERIFQSQAPGPEIKWGHCSCCDRTLTRVTALIDAWVRVREGEVRRNEASIWNSIRITAVNLPGHSQIEARNRITELESALATARKQLGETP